MARTELIKQIADEYGWTQVDVKRAIDASQDEVTTRDQIILCMIRYAGPALLERNRQLGAQKRVSNQRKEMITSLVDQLTSVSDFYATKLLPSLKDIIATQATYIADLLKEVSGKNQGGSNG